MAHALGRDVPQRAGAHGGRHQSTMGLVMGCHRLRSDVQERAEEVAAYFVDFLLARVAKALEVHSLLRLHGFCGQADQAAQAFWM